MIDTRQSNLFPKITKNEKVAHKKFDTKVFKETRLYVHLHHPFATCQQRAVPTFEYLQNHAVVVPPPGDQYPVVPISRPSPRKYWSPDRQKYRKGGFPVDGLRTNSLKLT